MSNGRSTRRRMARPSRWKENGPQVGTVRTWLRHAEEEGAVQRVGVTHTGKPGRPPHIWEMTPDGAAGQARKMSGRELSRERVRLIRMAGASTVWLGAVQAEIQRRREERT